MRGRTLSLLLAAFLTVPALAGAATIDKFNDSFPISFSTLGICTEVVDAEGAIHILGSTSLSKGGAYRCSFHFNLESVTGVGESSGDDYAITSDANFSIAGNLRNGSSRFRAIFHGTLNDLDTPGKEVSVQINVQFTVNAKGDLTAEVLNINVVCPI